MNQDNTGDRSDRGSIFLIQGYSTSDGPGIRTTVFTKGCPLKCLWCHNPESANSFPELMIHDDRCIGCLKCLEVCPEKAVTFQPETGRRIDRRRCSLCFACVAVCPAESLVRVGEYLTVGHILEEIKKDEIFIHRSGGGVTVSGGEPLLQGPFVLNLLKACKEQGLHTALDTSGYGPRPVLEALLDYLDLVLFDIKQTDPEAHLRTTGVGHELPLANLRLISDRVKVWIRLPLIPGLNDARDNLERVMFLSREMAVEKISLLPFNRFGDGKYLNLGRTIPLPGIKPFTKQRIAEIKAYLEKSGLPVTVGE